MSTDTTIPEWAVQAAQQAYADSPIKVIGNMEAGALVRHFAKAIHDAVMAERERDQWQQIATAPRDGTPILIQREQAEWPFIGYWANPYRYVKQGRGAWIGHEGGLHEDADGLMWQPLPAAPKSEG